MIKKNLNWSSASPGIKSKVLGLFSGLTGIGNTFFRFSDWKNVSSVLALESPLSEEDFLYNSDK